MLFLWVLAARDLRQRKMDENDSAKDAEKEVEPLWDEEENVIMEEDEDGDMVEKTHPDDVDSDGEGEDLELGDPHASSAEAAEAGHPEASEEGEGASSSS